MALKSRHLLGLDGISAEDIQQILDTAVSFKEVLERPIKKVPPLQGKTIVNLFFESSTRTRISFELAERRLSADVVNFAASGSSVSKGETLKDTARNLEALNIDLIVMRELTGGIYFGEPKGVNNNGKERVGFNTLVYSESEIERIVRASFDMAMKRRKKVTSVDKANVLDVMQLWRDVVIGVAKGYPEVELNHMYVDNCAMQLIRNPKQFDIICTGNMFGDILSDEAAMLTGSIGMLPSASLGEHTAMYEPVHGSAPDIAGKGIANPLATIASVAMMFKYSFDMPDEADAIDNAIDMVLKKGYRTADLVEDGKKVVSTREMGDLVVEALQFNH